MDHLLLWIARLGGTFGALLCAVALAARLGSVWYVNGIAVGTLLQLGLTGMVLACLAYLALLVERRGARPGA